MRLKLLCLLSFFLLSLSVGQLNTVSAAPQQDTAYDLINGVNLLRTSYGLPALEVNVNLMSAAQAQSDYQASTKTVTHLNADGETALLQAAKFGYGGGSEIVAVANVYAAFQATAVETITSWTENPRDLQNMFDPHTHVGAGAAINNGVIYYTLIVAHLADAPGTGATAPTDLGSDPLFMVATPRADGSIVHVVGFGHTLVLIAEKYATTVEALMRLNHLNADSVIFPGQELIIQPPLTGPTFTPSGPTFTPGPQTPTVTVLPTIAPTQTPRPTRTLSPADRPTSTLLPNSTTVPTPTIPPTLMPEPAPPSMQNMVRIALVILILLAAGLVLVGNFLDKKKNQ
ncbi:MAG: hypothetical protein Fur0022_07910 [Anaerolineales bacterium]